MLARSAGREASRFLLLDGPEWTSADEIVYIVPPLHHPPPARPRPTELEPTHELIYHAASHTGVLARLGEVRRSDALPKPHAPRRLLRRAEESHGCFRYVRSARETIVFTKVPEAISRDEASSLSSDCELAIGLSTGNLGNWRTSSPTRITSIRISYRWVTKRDDAEGAVGLIERL